jgi:protein O-GlcNAc transferase
MTLCTLVLLFLKTELKLLFDSFQDSLDIKACWGYESDCKAEHSFSVPHCPGDHKGWVATKKAQLDTYYAQGDFGYVRDQRKEMRLLCEPLFVVSIR